MSKTLNRLNKQGPVSYPFRLSQSLSQSLTQLRVVTLALCFGILGCGGGTKATPTTVATPSTTTNKLPTPSNPPLAPSPSRDECTHLFEHIIDLSVAQKTQKRPPVSPPTAAERSSILSAMIAKNADECHELTRQEFDCGMQSSNQKALADCQVYSEKPVSK